VIFVGTHHKSGTMLFAKIFKAIAKELSLNFYAGLQPQLPPETQIWFNERSRIQTECFETIGGIHVVRHPLDLICSAYRYHLLGNERWLNIPDTGDRPHLNGLTYKQKLSTFSVRDGVLFEMKHFSSHILGNMYDWDYEDRRFLNVKFEDTVLDFDGTLSNIFSFVGLDPSECLPIAQQFDLQRLGQERIDAISHVTNKNGNLSWKDYFVDDEMIDQFRKCFPDDLLSKLGYSKVFCHSILLYNFFDSSCLAA